MENQVLNKLVDSFDDFKERLIRIEENVKDVKNVKVEVEELKIKFASLESKTNSSHKRIDTLEQGDIKDLKNNQTWLWRTMVGGIIMGGISLLFFVVQAFIKTKGA